MARRLLLSLLLISAVLSVVGVVYAIPFLHVAGDSDGDHIVDGSDDEPAIYCSVGHADITGDGQVAVGDFSPLAADFGDEPPDNPLTDQNHNDQGDYLDFRIVTDNFGGSVATACDDLIADPIPPSGLGTTAGPDLNVVGPGTLLGVEGTITVTVSAIAPVPDPYRGYWISLDFDETVVEATDATNEMPATNPVCLEPPPDNSDDAAGPDGRVQLGCSVTAAAGGPGDLATFTFDVIAGGKPRFCLNSFGAPDAGGALNGSYTIGADVGAQAQSLDPCADNDLDGCSDEREDGVDPDLGGGRDPAVYWDFFDAPTPPSFVRDGAVVVADISAVVARFGSVRPGGPPDKATALAEALTAPPAPPAYHVGYDRTTSGMLTGPPNGSVTVLDIGRAVAQFGDTCIGPP